MTAFRKGRPCLHGKLVRSTCPGPALKGKSHRPGNSQALTCCRPPLPPRPVLVSAEEAQGQLLLEGVGFMENVRCLVHGGTWAG